MGCPDTLGSDDPGSPDFAHDGGMMQNYLFIGGPYNGTYHNVRSGCRVWSLPEPRNYPVPCYPGPTPERGFVVHNYRRLGLTHRGEFLIEDKFLGYIFVKSDLTDEQAIELFLELKRM